MDRIKILVNGNLKMSALKTAAQCVHAALGLYKSDPREHHSCIVLEVTATRFYVAQVQYPGGYVVTDAGYTEVPPGSKTAFAFYEPDPRTE
jgi:peptidyl-tRNA hydrolase